MKIIEEVLDGETYIQISFTPNEMKMVQEGFWGIENIPLLKHKVNFSIVTDTGEHQDAS